MEHRTDQWIMLRLEFVPCRCKYSYNYDVIPARILNAGIDRNMYLSSTHIVAERAYDCFRYILAVNTDSCRGG